MKYYDSLRLIFLKRPLRLERPKVIQFPVIDICNSKCQMCKIWENKKSEDISVERLKSGLSSSLFSEVTGIGFNGGEPTLRKDLPDLVQTAVDCLPSLKNISLITNAYNYQDVIRQVEAIGLICQKNNIHFDLMVSLDGYGEVHDKVRGKPGNFERAQHVIQFAKNSDLVANLRIGCTVIRENVYHLAELLEYCIENEVYIKFRLGVPHQRLYTENYTDPYALTEEEKYEFVEFLEGVIKNYETGLMQNHFYRSLIDQIVHNAPRKAGCDWQHRGATITAKGELAYCAVKSKALMDDISKGNPEDIYFSNQSYLNSIIKNDCDSCNHDYVGIPSRKEYQKQVIDKINERFGIKSFIKSLPGFSLIQTARQKKRFQSYYNHFSSLGTSIRSVEDNDVKKVMICGWYGTETLGDKAIIAGIIESVTNAFESKVKITVASIYPYVTEVTKKQMPELEYTNVISLDDAVRTVANYDYLLFGGGPMMAINELAPMQVLFEKSKQAGLTTIAAGVGVGPLGKKWLNSSIQRILQLSDIRIYRDQKSLEAASGLGIDVTSDVVAEDPALTWLRKSSSIENKQPVYQKENKVLLLGLRDFPYVEYASELSELEAKLVKSNYEESVVHALEKIIKEDPSWIIKPLPMCTNHFGDDDRWFYRRLLRKSEMLKAHIDDSLLGKELPPDEYVSAFKSADILLGMRFHSIVFALGLGTRSVAIDYTMGRGKVSALADRFSVPALPMLGLNADMIVDTVHQVLSGAKVQKSDICNDLHFEQSMSDMITNRS